MSHLHFGSGHIRQQEFAMASLTNAEQLLHSIKKQWDTRLLKA